MQGRTSARTGTRSCCCGSFIWSNTVRWPGQRSRCGCGECRIRSRKQPRSNKAHDENFIIGNDDVLAISVWKEPELTKAIPVRSDGKISMPLVGEMQATGRTPLQLERDITEKLKDFITTPEVTVIVQTVNSRKFNILGEVSKPGSVSADSLDNDRGRNCNSGRFP